MTADKEDDLWNGEMDPLRDIRTLLTDTNLNEATGLLVAAAWVSEYFKADENGYSEIGVLRIVYANGQPE